MSIKLKKHNDEYIKYKNISDSFLTSRGTSSNRLTPHRLNRHSISRKIDEEERRKKLDNDGTAQDMALKKHTLYALFIFLSIETFLVFLIAFLQGDKNNFLLDTLSFRVLLCVTILQITTMLTIAVHHLFPKR